jgi:glycosyltransferase involved in cell wall biosynthesis
LKRVLVLNYEFPPLGGGASTVSYEIAKRYVQKGCSVDVVTMAYRGLPKFEKREGLRIFRVWCLRSSKEICRTYEMISYVISAALFFMKKANRVNYDICHCHFLIPTGLVALFLKKVCGLNYIITIHGSDIPGYNTDRFRFEHYFTVPVLKAVARQAKLICSPSIFLKDLAKERIGPYAIKHIPNGIDLDLFGLNSEREKKNIILSSGRLLKRKGFQTLVGAVRDIELPYEVHLAGDGPYRAQLEEMASGSKTKIVFHGWLESGSEQLIALYRKASIYALLSEKENASIALLEGMAARCAVITTNVSGCPETIGDAGFLIDFDDRDSLKILLTALCYDRDLVNSYGNKAYARLKNYFLWDDIVESYLTVMVSL